MTTPKTDDNLVIGFDLGGTKMLATVMDASYRILGRDRTRTRASEGPEAVFGRIVETVRGAIADAGVKIGRVRGVGVGSPGPLDPFNGVILDTPNMGFRNFPLRQRLSEALGLPVSVDNDVNLGTLGEYHFGAGRGAVNLVGVFPGTGIGGGLILDGKLYRGHTGGAGEVGHMIIQAGGAICGCGQRGCVEALASRLFLAKEAAAMAARGDAPTIAARAGTDLSEIRSKALAKAYAAGEGPVVALIEDSARMLGIGLANVVNLLSPERIVLGGGLVEALPETYVELATQSMRDHAMAWLAAPVQVVAAELGDDAVVMGAAKLIRDALDDGE